MGRGRQTPCRVALAVETFNYNFIDKVADGPAEEGLTQDSTRPPWIYLYPFLCVFLSLFPSQYPLSLNRIAGGLLQEIIG